ACQTTCYESATTPAKQQVDALLACMEAQCEDEEGAAFNACLHQHCASQLGACFPTVTGSETCEDVVGCMDGCGANADDCWHACYESGTSQAQGQYDAIAECADTKCGQTTTVAAVQTCLGQQCGGEYAACFPPANCP